MPQVTVLAVGLHATGTSTWPAQKIIPASGGSAAASYLGITNEEGYIHVDSTMRVAGMDHMYAVGDCVDFEGPKMGTPKRRLMRTRGPVYRAMLK